MNERISPISTPPRKRPVVVVWHEEHDPGPEPETWRARPSAAAAAWGMGLAGFGVGAVLVALAGVVAGWLT